MRVGRLTLPDPDATPEEWEAAAERMRRETRRTRRWLKGSQLLAAIANLAAACNAWFVPPHGRFWLIDGSFSLFIAILMWVLYRDEE